RACCRGAAAGTSRDCRRSAARHNAAMNRTLYPLALATLLSACANAAPGPITTASGLIYQSLKEGSGASPAPTDTVPVHYRGTRTNGAEFDSSYKRGEPAEFALNRVIKSWTEGVGMMKPGGKARLTCPPQIAYG